MLNQKKFKNVLEYHMEKKDYVCVSNMFFLIVEELKEKNDRDTGYYMYEYAIFLFEQKDYEKAVYYFRDAYIQGYHCEEIEHILYEAFVEPNEKEFQESFSDNQELFHDRISSIHDMTYSDLPLNFIPLAENQYLIFNKAEKTFEGTIDLSQSKQKEFNKVFLKDEISDVTLAGTCQIHYYHDVIMSYQDKTFYLITPNIKNTLSFLKLPEIREVYLEHLYIFDSFQNCQDYLHKHIDKYLPRIYFGINSLKEQHNSMIEQEHKFRLTKEGRTSSNIILTIGIPSYNRGHRALNNVEHLLKSEFDAEIEIVVSDNCSIKNTEGYDVISQLEDSRIRYYRFPECPGENCNFEQVILLAKGKYTCLLSDEDKIYLSELSHYLKILTSNQNLSLVLARGTFQNSRLGYTFRKYYGGIDAFLAVFVTTNYISGLIYKTSMYRDLSLDVWTPNNLPINDYVKSYMHNCWCMFYALCGDCIIDENVLIQELEGEKEGFGIGNKNLIFPYATLEQRLSQHKGVISILKYLEPMLNKETIVDAYCFLCKKTIYLLTLIPKIRDNDWKSTCAIVRDNFIESIKYLREFLDQEDENQIIQHIYKLEQDYTEMESE